MRIALCFYGLVGSKANKDGAGTSLDPTIAYNLNNDNLILNNNKLGHDVDVFIHSWSHEKRDELISLYHPKFHLIEKQIDFPSSKSITYNRDFSEKLSMLVSALKNPCGIFGLLENKKKEAFRAYSRWYSSKKVLELKKEYEQENDFEYDCVMVMRLDVGFYSQLNFSELDMNNFYASNWNISPTKENNRKYDQENHNVGKGFLDFWFISNSKNMNEFARLYENITSYHVCPHRSAYQHTVTFTNQIKYIKYRWLDFEMIRRKEFNAEK
ncbi:hypothetical protein MUS1_03070 [Marinomonas ushuaiensis DSM 15871]|uniref:Uncharacterized protein n=1 Tax=Marinomonas ushuaiensis DSM 15871 TaxID=1122207 RepID=X7EBJ0_9GAMM|nr:hypothetical protein [Marinomonas ushuaiensis]ETX12581.1 hypothetical protein MUS1_03070 [Marinomonas ushuaiensis DSM 15871]